VMRSLGRALRMPMRSSERCRWQRRNSPTGPNPGFGDGLPERAAICIGSFLTAFEERSATAVFTKLEPPRSSACLSNQRARPGHLRVMRLPSLLHDAYNNGMRVLFFSACHTIEPF
jgi:hypothetical protein